MTCCNNSGEYICGPNLMGRTYKGMHGFNEFDYPVQTSGTQKFLVRYFLSNSEVSQPQELNIRIFCLISLNSMSLAHAVSNVCELTLGFVFRAFSAFCLQKALIAFFSSLPMPPKICFRIAEFISTLRSRSDLWSISVLSSLTGSASGCQRPEPTKHFPPGWMCT